MTQLENAGSPQEKLPESLSVFIEGMQVRLGKSTDIIYRFITLGPLSAVLVFIEGLSDPQSLIQAVHEDAGLFHELDEFTPVTCLKLLQERTLTLGKVGEISNYTEVETEILAGNTILFIEGSVTALSAGTEGSQAACGGGCGLPVGSPRAPRRLHRIPAGEYRSGPQAHPEPEAADRVTQAGGADPDGCRGDVH